MNLTFSINKPLLLVSAIFKKTSNVENLTSLKNRLWEEHKIGYQFLKDPDIFGIFASTDFTKDLTVATTDAVALVANGVNSEEFKAVITETEEYKNWLEKEWNQNKEKVEQELKSILKIDLPNESFEAVVVHPKIGLGRSLGKNRLAWGHSEDWPNYSLIYLAHEMLHSVLGSSPLAHAVIELATDNELRIRLNGSGEYLYIDEKPIGHDFLLELEKYLLSSWREFLKSSENVTEYLKRKEKEIPATLIKKSR